VRKVGEDGRSIQYCETTPLQIHHYTASKLPLNIETPLAYAEVMKPYPAMDIAKEAKLAGARRAQLS
jgi:hypothetical protein